MSPTEAERTARQARRNARTMRRHLRQLHESSGPRYVVWYWLQGGKTQAVKLQIHCQTDDLSEARQQRKLAGAQPCCGGGNSAHIFERRQYVRDKNKQSNG